MTLDSTPELARRVLHLEKLVKRSKPADGLDNAALSKRLSALESAVTKLRVPAPAKAQAYVSKPTATRRVVSNFDETLMKRLTKLEREVERLKVKEILGTWLAWTPTVTGWAAGYTCIARYCKVGKMCFVYLHISGTSNENKARATLPLSASTEPSFSYFQVPVFSDNSIYDYVGGQCFAQVRPTDNAVWFWLDGSAQGWTTSGDKYVQTSLFYEVA